ncbi:hypothetical protein MCEGE11_01681 [Sphingomonadaceae bacterium]
MNDFDRMIDIDDIDQMMGKRKNTINELAYDIDEVSTALREHADIMERRIESLDDKLSELDAILSRFTSMSYIFLTVIIFLLAMISNKMF